MQAALLSSVKMDWCTPSCVLERVRRVGVIVLDPCTMPDNPCDALQWCDSDGLDVEWGDGLTYVNPPYGRELPRWLAKCRVEAGAGAEIIALVPSRTDTAWWHASAEDCDAIAFWRGRLTFEGAPAPAPFPSCLFYWGHRTGVFKRAFRDVARVIPGGGA